MQDEPPCNKNYVQITADPHISFSKTIKLCGTDLPQVYLTESNVMLLEMRRELSAKPQGFVAVYWYGKQINFFTCKMSDVY